MVQCDAAISMGARYDSQISCFVMGRVEGIEGSPTAGHAGLNRLQAEESQSGNCGGRLAKYARNNIPRFWNVVQGRRW